MPAATKAWLAKNSWYGNQADARDRRDSLLAHRIMEMVAADTGLTVNDAEFLGYRKGELLFLGVTGQSQTPTDGQTPAWTLTFKFAASPTRGDPMPEGLNDPDLLYTIAPGLVVRGIEGWDYVWMKYGERTDNGYTVLVPTHAYVEQMYPYGDFTQLGLFS